MASNLRRCSDACEITCWNGGKVRVAFVIDAFAREVIAHVAVTGAGISGCDVRDMMLVAIERRFGADSAPHLVEHRSDNGSCCIARIHATSPGHSASFPASRLSDRQRAMA